VFSSKPGVVVQLSAKLRPVPVAVLMIVAAFAPIDDQNNANDPTPKRDRTRRKNRWTLRFIGERWRFR